MKWLLLALLFTICFQCSAQNTNPDITVVPNGNAYRGRTVRFSVVLDKTVTGVASLALDASLLTEFDRGGMGDCCVGYPASIEMGNDNQVFTLGDLSKNSQVTLSHTSTGGLQAEFDPPVNQTSHPLQKMETQ
jgi:hypothetical protein